MNSPRPWASAVKHKPTAGLIKAGFESRCLEIIFQSIYLYLELQSLGFDIDIYFQQAVG